MSERERLLNETIAARNKAAALLRALQEAKEQAESLAPSPKGDLYKRVTGSSSLENAIAEARRTVEAYERLISDLEKPAAPEVVVRPPERALRP